MLALISALATVLTQTAPGRTDLRPGQQLAQEKCGACHAIGPSGRSPQPKAPPLRTLSSRFDIEGLPESLAEGIYVGHPQMPQTLWEARDIEQFMEYLRSLQPTKPNVNR